MDTSTGPGRQVSTGICDAAAQLCWTTTAEVTDPTCGSPVLGATTYSSNANGQRTASTPAWGTATGSTYNGAGELTGVSGTTTASYTYDGAGLRASKTVGGTTTVFTWDTAGSTPQLLSDGATDYVYGPAGVPVEQFNASGAGGQQYYFGSAHGSTVALTSSTGAVDATWTFSPWGAITAHAGSASTPILFAGAHVDTETGLLFLQARYYDPKTALFLTVDALVDLTHQAYLYTGDNPLNRLDPTGLFDWGLALGITAGALGFAALTVATSGSDIMLCGGATALTTVLDGSVAVAGASSTGYDWESIQCGLDALSLGTGVGGLFGDFADMGGACGMGADFFSGSYTWESVGITIYDGTRDDDDSESGSEAGGSSRPGVEVGLEIGPQADTPTLVLDIGREQTTATHTEEQRISAAKKLATWPQTNTVKQIRSATEIGQLLDHLRLSLRWCER